MVYFIKPRTVLIDPKIHVGFRDVKVCPQKRCFLEVEMTTVYLESLKKSY